jgi:peptide/nickel transport system substrate-binding protein
MFKRIIKSIAAIVLAAFVLTGVSGCSDSKPAESKSNSTNQPVVINLEGGDWGYPTPFSHYSRGPGVYKMTLIFDSLLERGEKGYIPWLADKWDISEDGLTYTFTLKDNVKWQDGEPMTAEDVKFSFEYFAKHPPVSNDLTADGKSFIQSVEAPDAKTVVFKVEKPLAILLGKIGNTRIIPRHIWEKVEDPLKFNTPEAVIGTGPYVLKEYSKEQGAYKYEAFKDFWGPEQLVNTLQFVPVSDSILAFDKGEIDLTGITTDILAKYQDNKEYKVIQNPAFWGYRLIFNMNKRTELKEKEIRQAFAYAIDKNELVEKVARKAAVPGNAGYLPVGHTMYNSNAVNYDFDIEKAKQLLKGNKLAFKLLAGNSNDEVRIAELLKISLAKAGIDISITSADTKTRDAAIKKGDYEIVLNGHGGWGGDADLLRTTYAANEKTSNQSPSSDGIPGYNNEQINELCKQQLYEMDTTKRKEIIFKLQELIAEEIPQIPLYNTTGYIVFRPEKFDGWKYNFDHHEVTHNKLSFLDVKQ